MIKNAKLTTNKFQFVLTRLRRFINFRSLWWHNNQLIGLGKTINNRVKQSIKDTIDEDEIKEVNLLSPASLLTAPIGNQCNRRRLR